MEEQIAVIINDPEKGLIGDLRKLKKILNENGIKATTAQIKKVRDEQPWYQTTKRTRRKPKFGNIMAPAPGDQYYMDVIVYTRHNVNKYKYVLNVVDVFSRYASSRALTNMIMKESKRGNKKMTLMDAIKDIMKEMGYPNNLNCDNQFQTDEFKQLMNNKGVNVYFSKTDDLVKNSIVESFNRTLSQYFQRWRQSTNGKKWYLVLDKLIKKYNNTEHSNTKAKPKDLWNGDDVSAVKPKLGELRFGPGDRVRIRLKSRIFKKGYEPTYSEAIYTIVEMQGRKYKIRNESGNTLEKLYSDYELEPINTKQTNKSLNTKKRRKINSSTSLI